MKRHSGHVSDSSDKENIQSELNMKHLGRRRRPSRIRPKIYSWRSRRFISLLRHSEMARPDFFETRRIYFFFGYFMCRTQSKEYEMCRNVGFVIPWTWFILDAALLDWIKKQDWRTKLLDPTIRNSRLNLVVKLLDLIWLEIESSSNVSVSSEAKFLFIKYLKYQVQLSNYLIFNGFIVMCAQ